MRNEFIRYSIYSFILVLIAGCSGSILKNGSNNVSHSDESVQQIEIIVPKTYLTTSNTMPIIIENHGKSLVNNLSYSLPINDANLDLRKILNKCKSIPAHNTCQIDMELGTGVKVGSAQVQATLNGKSFYSDLVGFIAKPINNNNGADAITLYGDSVLNTNGDSFINTMVTAVVGAGINNTKSRKSFNHIALSDGNGIENPYCQQVSGPDGAFHDGDVLTFYCRFPSSVTYVEMAPQFQQIVPQSTTQGLQAQSMSVNATMKSDVTVIETGAVQLSMSVKGQKGNIVQQPSKVTVNPDSPSSTIQLINNGDAPAAVGEIKPETQYVKITQDSCSGKTLDVGATCSYVVELVDSTAHVAGRDNVTVSAEQNTSSNTDSNVAIDYVGTSPVANIVPNTDSVDFVNSALAPSMVQVVTLENSGSAPMTPILPKLPDSSFAIDGASVANYCYGGGTVLSPGQSCQFNLVMNSDPNVSSNGSFNLDLPFTYTESGNTNDYSSSLHVSYITNKFIQFNILDKNASPITSLSFNSVYNDNNALSTQDITIYNQGNQPAQNLAFIIKGANNLFKITNNTCTTQLLSGQACNMTLSFGPTSLASNDYNASLILSYTSTVDNTAQTIGVDLNGTVVKVGAALLEGVVTNSTFTGNGVATDPYQITQNVESTPVIIYTVSNVGSSSAESVAIDLAPNNGWVVVQDNCTSAVLPPSGACDVQLTVQDTTTVGTKSLDLKDLTVSWTDGIPTPVVTPSPVISPDPSMSPTPIIPTASPTPGVPGSSGSQHRVSDEQTGKIYVKVLPSVNPTPVVSPTPTGEGAGSIDYGCTYVAQGSMNAGFYSIVENLPSSSTQVSIYAKNDLHWDNWGWCDGANDSNSPLVINPGETRVYCGYNSQYGNRIWSDTPHLQHEWWFNPTNQGWRQTYSEQWLTYKNYMWGGDGNQMLIKIVENDDWNNSYNYVPYSNTSCQDHIYGYDQTFDNGLDAVLIYTILNNHQMSVSCHRLGQRYITPFTTDYVDLRNNLQKYKDTYNTCPNSDGSLKIMNY